MSVQSDWKPTTTDKPAEFKLDYATIKVQAAAKPGSNGPELQVRISTLFNTDWQEGKFEEWSSEWENSDIEEYAELAYPALKAWRDAVIATGKGKEPLRELIELIDALERNNAGLIRV